MTARRRPAVDAAAQALADLMAKRRRASMGWLRHCDMSMAQVHVVTTLLEHGTISIGALAEELAISAPSATGLVDRLVERGLVERVRSEDDRRTVRVSLSPSGLAMAEQIHGVRPSEFSDVLAELSDEELAQVVHLIGRLRQAVADVAARRPAEPTRQAAAGA